MAKKPEPESRDIRIYNQGEELPLTLSKNIRFSFIWLPAGKQTAPGREITVGSASVDNFEGATIMVTAKLQGRVFKSRLHEEHFPLFKRMHSKQKNLYRIHPNVRQLDFQKVK